MSVEAFHTKYRPTKLSKLVGHTQAVTRLNGMLKSGKLPNALLITGPSSAGKTTLARALAFEINGKLDTDYREMNMSDTRSIDDIRELVKQSKFRPRGNKRIYVLDEAQGLLSNPAAAAALLKPLEEPSPSTLWVLCSMDPAKFQSGNGKAIANRCTQFILQPHTEDDLRKQAKRIIKGEEMTYVTDECIDQIILSCNGEMRTLANLLQATQQYYDGLDEQPKKLKPKHLSDVLSTAESSDDKVVVQIMSALYRMKFTEVQKGILSISDGFRVVQKLVQAAQFCLNVAVLGGEKHPKVWWTPEHRAIHSQISPLIKAKELSLGDLALVNEALVNIKARAASFQVSPEELLSAELYRVIKNRQALTKSK